MKFTIRDLLWLTVLVAIFVGWYLEWRADLLDRRRDAETIEKLKAELDSYHVRIVPIQQKSPGRGLRIIPGEWDYQYPPSMPIELEP